MSGKSQKVFARVDVCPVVAIDQDLSALIQMERESFDDGWTKDDFVNCWRQKDCQILIAYCFGKRVGFTVCLPRIIESAKMFCSSDRFLHVLHFVVRPSYRREKVGTQLINALINLLPQYLLTRIVLEIRETNIAMQLFLRGQKFRAVCTLPQFFRETQEDAYLMEYKIKNERDPLIGIEVPEYFADV